MKTEDIIKLALLGGLAYFVYTYLQKSSPVQGTASVIADFITWATLPASMVVQGNIAFPDGTLYPLADVNVRQSPTGAVVANYQGHYYQLSPSDANGNWPATLIQ